MFRLPRCEHKSTYAAKAAAAVFAVAGVLGTISGCGLPCIDGPPLLTSSATQFELRTIQGLSLTDESMVPPLSLEQALPNTSDTPPEPEDILPIEPPDKLILSLGEARAAALAANLDIGVELLNPAIARQMISEETARFESTFASSVQRRRLDPPPGFAAGGIADTTFDRVDAAIINPLTTGGTVTVLHDVTKADTHLPGVANTADTSLGVRLSQPLLRGAGWRVNTADIQIARAASGMADAQSKLTAIQVLAEVERAYWRLYAARQIYEIAQQQLDLAERQLKAAQRLVQAGRFPNVEVLRAESGLLTRKDAAISAETDVLLAQRELKRIMQRPDVPVDNHTDLVLATDPGLIELVFDRHQLASRAVDNRMEMLQIQLQLLSNKIDIEVQQNSVLPRLDLTAGLSSLGQDRAYRRSLDNLSGGEFGDRLVGLTLDVPLSGNLAAQARLRQAQLRRIQTLIQQKRVGVLIVQEVYDAIDRIEQNWQRIIATHRATIAARKTYEGEARLHEAGQRTSTEVFLVLTNLAEAQAREVQAVTDYEIAKVDLALAAGAMLGYGQVHWNPCQGADAPPPDPKPEQRLPEPEMISTPGGAIFATP